MLIVEFDSEIDTVNLHTPQHKFFFFLVFYMNCNMLYVSFFFSVEFVIGTIIHHNSIAAAGYRGSLCDKIVISNFHNFSADKTSPLGLGHSDTISVVGYIQLRQCA